MMEHCKTQSAALLLPASMVVALAGTTFAGEVEPNDTFATANATGLIDTGGVQIPGAFMGNGDSPEHDVDLYSFEITAGASTPRVVSLSVDKDAGATVDLFVRLFDATGREIGVNDDRSVANSDPQRSAYLIEPGVFYVGVSAAANPRYNPIIAGDGGTGGSGGYALSIELADAPAPTSPFEPNDDFATATAVGSASFAIANEFLGDGPHGWSDADYFLLDVTAPARIDVTVLAASIGSPINPSVGLWNQFAPLGFINGTQTSGGDSAKTFLVPRPMPVYFVVAGLPERVHGPLLLQRNTAGAAGPYGLSVNVEYLGMQTESPTNDSFRSASQGPTFVALPGRPETWETSGFIGDGPYAEARGDRDFYRMNLEAQSRLLRITVEAAPGSNLDPIVAFFPGRGRLATNDNRGDAGRTAELLLPTPCQNFEFEQVTGYVMVAGARQRAMVNPGIPWPGFHHLEDFIWGAGPGSTGAYTLTLDISTEAVSCLNEPDDTLAEATSTGLVDEGVFYCSGADAADSHCPAGPQFDVDFWSVDVHSAPVHISVNMFSECFLDPVFENTISLFDESGEELARCSTFGSGLLCDLEYSLQTPGTYFVAFRGISLGTIPFDPNESCAGEISSFAGTYAAVIQMSRGSDPAPPEGTTASAPAGPPEPPLLFATSIDATVPVVDVIDAATGAVTHTMDAPEPLSGAEGLATDGSQLYFMGTGWFPWLYELDPLTGGVFGAFTLWAGSGLYSDATLIGRELFVMDLLRQSVHVFDLPERRWDRTLRIGANSNVTLSGAMAGLAGPSRLFLAGETASSVVHVVEPEHGGLVRSMAVDESAAAMAGIGSDTLATAGWGSSDVNIMDRQGVVVSSISQARPVLSLGGLPDFGPLVDFDADGDVDLLDFAAMARCFADAPSSACDRGDGDENGVVDLADYTAFPPRMTGP